MPNSLSTRNRRVFPLAMAFAFAALPALAAQNEGTPEQREACAPDAITLCQDTIPDVPKTEACMKAHLAQLSPKCRAMFTAATAPHHRAPSAAASAPAVATTEAATPAPAASPGFAPQNDGLDGYRASIAEDCKQGLIDPFTCKNTESALGMH